MIEFLVFVSAGYLLGSVPFGLIASKVLRGVDVRDYGSGTTGMTNVQRTVGTRAAAVVLVLDILKPMPAVVLARIFTDSPGVEVAAAFAAIVGHNWPVFVGFKGGRGIATGWGGLFILSPITGILAGAVGAPTIAIWRFVSLGSLLGAFSGAALLVALAVAGVEPLPYAWYGLLGATLVVARHMENIRRLLRGRERKLGQRAEMTEAQPKTGRGRGLRWPRSV